MPAQAQTAMLRCRQTDPQDVSVHNRIAAQQFVPADGAVEIDLHAAGVRFVRMLFCQGSCAAVSCAGRSSTLPSTQLRENWTVRLSVQI